MKVTSIVEKDFVNSIIKKRKRLDGRNLTDGRTLNITFLLEWGGCIVHLGNTIVLAQVSAEVSEPRAVSPTEGALHVNFELSSMSAPDINLSRSSSEFVETQRSLERCIRDSKCIDLESLCIVAGAKVWTIRVDLHAMNLDGNVLECASIAAISALAHFRRPDVTVVGTEITVHSLDDREPVPLNLHHMPIAINLALYDQGTYILVDPTDVEERIAEGCYIVGMNAHQELCFVHRRGSLLLHESTIQKCEEIAIRRAQIVTQAIRSALDDDSYKRTTKVPIGLGSLLQTGTILGAKQPIYNFDINSVKSHVNEIEMQEIDSDVITIEYEKPPKSQTVVVSAAKEKALKILSEAETSVFEGGTSKWSIDHEEEESTSSEEEPTVPSENLKEEPIIPSKNLKEDPIVPSKILKEEPDSSSEEESAFMEGDQVDVKKSVVREWYSKNPFS
ncbi:hypothetical protein CEXT_194311 [Caerostris extrusa]|uniref:Exosome complex component RRP45 n=1 Tax=Caerostris extrusa TaxID=172846 RepID=A0AAV4MNB2_CAEEX|nr:hypothetical protein CEXT_194311 [Caerostris extrusa]